MAIDLSPLMTSIDFSSIAVAVLAVAGVLIGVYVVSMACRFILLFFYPSGVVRFGGQVWERDVYEAALRDVKSQARKGALVDAESRAALDRFEGREKPRSRRSSYKI